MDYTKYKIDKIQNILKECLTDNRFIHSIGVMEKSMELAKRFNSDIQKAQIAGLLHDCAKCLSFEELNNYTYCLIDCEKTSSKTWHAPIGAIIAKNKYGVTDDEILSAIRWHTIGNLNMSVLEKIVFIADKIESRTRETFIREKIENALNNKNSLDDAMFMCFKLTINSLVDRNLPICFQTIEVYNEFLNLTHNIHN